jgi:CheY-like chemotaxis protein
MGQTVLIIEDDVDTRDMLAKFLQLEGYDVQLASNGRQALDLFSSGVNACVIVLDLMMPVMDGRSFREQQLQNPGLATIPTIVFSAYRDVAKTAGELNAAGHLAKPLKLPDLLRTVRQYCQG